MRSVPWPKPFKPVHFHDRHDPREDRIRCEHVFARLHVDAKSQLVTRYVGSGRIGARTTVPHKFL